MRLRPTRPRPPRSILPAAARRLPLPLLTVLATVAALATVLLTGGPAAAHGAPMAPGSRTFLCYEDALTSTGEIKPQNAACAAASGTASSGRWTTA